MTLFYTLEYITHHKKMMMRVVFLGGLGSEKKIVGVVFLGGLGSEIGSISMH